MDQPITLEIDEDVFLPCYRHLLTSIANINFLWGGRDSGKSYFIAEKLIIDCLSKDYFRCILIKKTAESIKDAQWQTIKDICEQWGITHLFDFKVSPLEIVCINGNKFIARGCDKPEKLKSISNPSDAWYEEGNQLTEQDYIVATTTLRSSLGAVQEWFSLNPECDENYEDFWLYKIFFKDHYEKGQYAFVGKIEFKLPDGSKYVRTYTSTHTTYHDNLQYCSPDRIANHESLKSINAYYYQVYTLGLWGKRIAGGEFLKCWKTNIHVGAYPYDPEQAIYLYFDENVNPYFPCGFFQVGRDEKSPRLIHCIAAESPNNKVSWMGREIVRKLTEWGHKGRVFIGGDATSQKEDVKLEDGHDMFRLMMSELKAFNPTRRTSKSNPSVTMSANFFNTLLEGGIPKMSYGVDTKCRKAILDYENTKEDKNGKVDKSTVRHPVTEISYQPWGHFVDLTRYFLCDTFASEYAMFQRGGVASVIRTGNRTSKHGF